jgi:hypothetical protein
MNNLGQKVRVRAGSLIFPDARAILDVDAGPSIAAIIERAFPGTKGRYREYARVWLNGTLVPRVCWRYVKPKPGALVNIGIAPAGTTDLAQAARTAIGTGVTLAGSALGGPLGAIAGSVVAPWIANLIPVPTYSDIPKRYALTNASNANTKYNPIPKVYGRMRVFPRLAAPPYTYWNAGGTQQSIRAVYVVGYGPLALSDIRIGANSVGDFDMPITVQTENDANNPGRKITLYGQDGDVFEQQVNKPLEYSSSWYPNTVVSPTGLLNSGQCVVICQCKNDGGNGQWSLDAGQWQNSQATLMNVAAGGITWHTIQFQLQPGAPTAGITIPGDVYFDGISQGMMQSNTTYVLVADFATGTVTVYTAPASAWLNESETIWSIKNPFSSYDAPYGYYYINVQSFTTATTWGAVPYGSPNQPGLVKASGFSIDLNFPDGLYMSDGSEGNHVNFAVRWRMLGQSGPSSWNAFVPGSFLPGKFNLIPADWINALTSLNNQITALKNNVEAILTGEQIVVSALLPAPTLAAVSAAQSTINNPGFTPTTDQQTVMTNATSNLSWLTNFLQNTAIPITSQAYDGISQINDDLSGVINVLNVVNAVANFFNTISTAAGGVYQGEYPVLSDLAQFIYGIDPGFQLAWTFIPAPAGQFLVSTDGHGKSPFTVSIAMNFPVVAGASGQYEVQIMRASSKGKQPNNGPVVFQGEVTEQDPDQSQSQVNVAVFRTTFESTTWISPQLRAKVCLLALDVPATDQLTGTLDGVNCIAEAIIPYAAPDPLTPTGYRWTQPRRITTANGAFFGDANGYPTASNPVWCACDARRGIQARNPAPDTNFDYPTLAALAAQVAGPFREPGRTIPRGAWYFDMYYPDAPRIDTVIDDACRAMKAMRHDRDGKFSIIADSIGSGVPVALLTMRDSRGFTATKSMAPLPHALKITYINADDMTRVPTSDGYGRGYNPDVWWVYQDGYGPPGGINPTIVQSLEVKGVIDSPNPSSPFHTGQVYRWGRYLLACMKLRPEVYKVQQSWKACTYERGDLVEVQYDVTLWGMGTAKVVSLTSSDPFIVTFDDDVSQWDWNMVKAVSIYTVAGVETMPAFYDPSLGINSVRVLPSASDPSLANVAAGNLAAFGTNALCIVKEIRSGPNRDSAEVTLVDYAPEVHNSDIETIPTYNAGITLPYTPTQQPPPAPFIMGIVADDRALFIAADGTVQAQIQLNITLPTGTTAAEKQAAHNVTGIQAQYRPAIAPSSNHAWTNIGPFTRDLTTIYIQPVTSGQSYDVRIRSVTNLGLPSAWTTQYAVYVEGKLEPPPDPYNLAWNGTTLTWSCVTPLDFAGFEIRVQGGQGGDWDSAASAHDGLVTAASFDVSNYEAGTWTFFVRAVNTSRIYSVNSAQITKTLVSTGPLIQTIDLPTHLEASFWNMTLAGTTFSANAVGDPTTEPCLIPGEPAYPASGPVMGRLYPKALVELDIEDMVSCFAGSYLYVICAAIGELWGIEYKNRDSELWQVPGGVPRVAITGTLSPDATGSYSNATGAWTNGTYYIWWDAFNCLWVLSTANATYGTYWSSPTFCGPYSPAGCLSPTDRSAEVSTATGTATVSLIQVTGNIWPSDLSQAFWPFDFIPDALDHLVAWVPYKGKIVLPKSGYCPRYCFRLIAQPSNTQFVVTAFNVYLGAVVLQETNVAIIANHGSTPLSLAQIFTQLLQVTAVCTTSGNTAVVTISGGSATVQVFSASSVQVGDSITFTAIGY